MARVLLTGAAGRLGTFLHQWLAARGHDVIGTDIRQKETGPSLILADLADRDAVDGLMSSNIDAIIHMGGLSGEASWTDILDANIAGTYNIFEAGRRAGVRRVVYASSHHAVGMYPTEQTLDDQAALRPDSLYGLSKCFGENTARYYWDKFGLEAVCLRIGSTRPKPSEARELSTWLSEPDFTALVHACLTAVSVEFSIVYGVSDNTHSWWSNAHASHIGYAPKDNAEIYRAQVQAQIDAGKAAPDYALQGGKRADYGLIRRDSSPDAS